MLPLVPPSLPAPLIPLFSKVSGLGALSPLCEAEQHHAHPTGFCQALLSHLGITVHIAHDDWQKLPTQGPRLFVANHPFGLLEGLVLATQLLPRVPDLRVLANSLLHGLAPLRQLVIPVEVFERQRAGAINSRALRESRRWLDAGNALVLFPAGEVSAWDWHQRSVADKPWSTSAARLAQWTGATVIPLYFAGANSIPFQMLGMIHPRLRTLRLPAELMNKRGARVQVRLGQPIRPSRLTEAGDLEQQTQLLRQRTEWLRHREEARPIPLSQGAAIAPAGAIGSLPSDSLITANGDYEIHVTTAAAAPALLEEIGRLRELCFRAVGEGTGAARDLDTFDAHYRHLFLWRRSTGQVVGAYRVAPVTAGAPLYTSTLFRFPNGFLRRLGSALEIGRAFIRPEYQREYAPLLLLWKGLLRYATAHAQANVLFGPASITARYAPLSRALMAHWLETKLPAPERVPGIHPFHPSVAHAKAVQRIVPHLAGLDDLSQAISDLEPGGTGVPVLLRQYAKAGARVHGFNVDPHFQSALDVLVSVDLRDLPIHLRERLAR